MSENENCSLKLYIAGISVDNQESIIEFKEILKKQLRNPYTLEGIDIFDRPELAEEEKIIATPTLMRKSPLPIKKIILEFNDKEKLIKGVGAALQDLVTL